MCMNVCGTASISDWTKGKNLKMGANTVRQYFGVTKEMRNKQGGHGSFLVWFTGLSGAGKSTMANHLELALHEKGITTYLLDGDNVRLGLNKDLTFKQEDRSENLRRVGEVANLMIDAGVVVLAAFIAPFRNDRENIRAIVGEDNYVEIFVSTSLQTCEQRDVKGLYEKARKGEIADFTGVSAPYEVPENAHIRIDTEQTSLDEAVRQILEFITPKLNVHE